ncbi:MAG: DNA-binding response regulator [Planctomycetaceae bacterium]|nr:DNA-binding response regulator [Planctomycetaceae bacterium]
MTISILVADDHEVVRAGIRTLLEGTDIHIAGEATSGKQTVQLIPRLKPQVVVLGMRLRDGDGLATLGQIRAARKKLPVLIYSAYDIPAYLARAYASNANGYVLKTETGQKLLDAIQVVSQGKSIWTRKTLPSVAGFRVTPRLENNSEVPLTLRESEVLRQVVSGLTNKEIAMSLHISFETVKEHVQHILRKIGVLDRTQAAVWAARKHLC